MEPEIQFLRVLRLVRLQPAVINASRLYFLEKLSFSVYLFAAPFRHEEYPVLSLWPGVLLCVQNDPLHTLYFI